jgi:hypothetical protein
VKVALRATISTLATHRRHPARPAIAELDVLAVLATAGRASTAGVRIQLIPRRLARPDRRHCKLATCKPGQLAGEISAAARWP